MQIEIIFNMIHKPIAVPTAEATVLAGILSILVARAVTSKICGPERSESTWHFLLLLLH
jgi:hypothetical protein